MISTIVKKCRYCGSEFGDNSYGHHKSYCSPRCRSRQNDGTVAGKNRDCKKKPLYWARGVVDANPNAFNVNACADQQPQMLRIPLSEDK